MLDLISSTVQFPKSKGIIINMMPFIIGNQKTLPIDLRPYQPLIDLCELPKGQIGYLTIHESHVLKNQTQRRCGIHTDGFKANGKLFDWGDGKWGGKGVFVASTDGRTAFWDDIDYDVDHHGAVKKCYDKSEAIIAKHNHLYRISDRTPHESLPAKKSCMRQFFRLVADELSVWYTKDSTHSPFGILPNARIIAGSKFDENSIS